jgi:exo-beta-1,3-glucanase (GH17 family)
MILRSRFRTPLLNLVALTMVIAAAGCGGANSAESTEIRPLVLEHDGYWIGNAVCYGPHRDGQRPGESGPNAEQLAEDLRLMTPHWKLLRIYGASGSAEQMLGVIRDSGSGMKVVLGTWIAPDDDESNRRELEAAIRLANEFSDIVLAVSVGNETQISWSAHRSPMDKLVEYVREVRSHVSVPVTVADDFNFWNKPESRVVADEIDFLTVHAHPMWNGLQREEALAWLRSTLDEVQTLHPEHTLVLGETGWATSVHDEGEQSELIKGRPGESEQKKFYEDVRTWAAAERQPVFFFEAFDENWKGGSHPGEVEKHWGVFRADRTAKAAVASRK